MSETEAGRTESEDKKGDHGTGSDYESAEESKDDETLIKEVGEEIPPERRRDAASDDEETVEKHSEIQEGFDDETLLRTTESGPIELLSEVGGTESKFNELVVEPTEVNLETDKQSEVVQQSDDFGSPQEYVAAEPTVNQVERPDDVHLAEVEEKLEELLKIVDSGEANEVAMEPDTVVAVAAESNGKSESEAETESVVIRKTAFSIGSTEGETEIGKCPAVNGDLVETPLSGESEDESLEGEEEEESTPISAVPADIDEDRKNPAFIPKRGGFYQHDLRVFDEPSKTEPKESAKLLWMEKQNKWRHDMFIEDEQTPKSRRELVGTYGYDIREEEKAPRATRQRKYSRNAGQKPRSDRERKLDGKENLSDGGEEEAAEKTKNAKGFQYRRAHTEEITTDSSVRRRGKSEENEDPPKLKNSDFPPLSSKASDKVAPVKSPGPVISRNTEERRKNESQLKTTPPSHQENRRRDVPRYEHREQNREVVERQGVRGDFAPRGKPRSYQQSRHDRYESEAAQPGNSRGGVHHQQDSTRNQGDYRGYDDNYRRRSDRWAPQQSRRDDYQPREYNRQDNYERDNRHYIDQPYDRTGYQSSRGGGRGGPRHFDRYDESRSDYREESHGDGVRGRGKYPPMEFRRRNYDDRGRNGDDREDNRQSNDYRRRGNEPNEVFPAARGSKTGSYIKRQSPNRMPNGQPNNPPVNWRQELPPRFKHQKENRNEESEERSETRTSDGGRNRRTTPSPTHGDDAVKGDKGKPKRYSAARKNQPQGFQQSSEAAEPRDYPKEQSEVKLNTSGGHDSQSAERANYYEPYETEPLQFDPSMMSGGQALPPSANSAYQYMRSQQPPPFIPTEQPYYVPSMNQYPPAHIPYNGQPNAFLPTSTPGVQMAMPPYPQSQELMYSQAGNVDYYPSQQADVGTVYYDQMQQPQRGQPVNYHQARQTSALPIQSPSENRRQNRLN